MNVWDQAGLGDTAGIATRRTGPDDEKNISHLHSGDILHIQHQPLLSYTCIFNILTLNTSWSGAYLDILKYLDILSQASGRVFIWICRCKVRRVSIWGTGLMLSVAANWGWGLGWIRAGADDLCLHVLCRVGFLNFTTDTALDLWALSPSPSRINVVFRMSAVTTVSETNIWLQ